MIERLCDLPPGARARLVTVGLDRRLVRRLAELGLTAGSEVGVVQSSGGPMVLAARGARVALGRSVAELMRVERLDPVGDYS
jgi:Fur family ferric uptake transcriptional regulator